MSKTNRTQEKIHLSNGRILIATDEEVVAWPSAGALERGDGALYTVTIDPRARLVSRTQARKLTGFSRSAIHYAVQRGDLHEVRLGEGHSTITIDSLLEYAEHFPHSHKMGFAHPDHPQKKKRDKDKAQEEGSE